MNEAQQKIMRECAELLNDADDKLAQATGRVSELAFGRNSLISGLKQYKNLVSVRLKLNDLMREIDNEIDSPF